MAENILEKIIKKKVEKIENLKKTTKLDTLNELINKNKSFIEAQEKAFEDKLNEAVEAKLKEIQTSEASDVEVAEEVTTEEVLDNAEASNVEISNSSETLSEEPESLAERFQKAFEGNVNVKY